MPVTPLPSFHLITAVWGADYIRFFFDVVLPSQLTPGNLLALAEARALYQVYTYAGDEALLEDGLAASGLAAVMPYRVIALPRPARFERYSAVNALHRQAVRDGEAARAAMLFLTPDALWPEGSFRRVLELAREGKRAVLHWGSRVYGPTFLPAYREALAACAGPLPGRELVRLGLEHLHPLVHNCFWDSPHFEVYSQVYFGVGDEGLVARCFHLHPLMIWPVRLGTRFRSTIDDDYISRCVPRFQDVYVSTDSDELLCLGAGGEDEGEGAVEGQASFATPWRVSYWAWQKTRRDHRRYFFDHAIRVHKHDLDAPGARARWEPVEREAEAVARRVARRLRVAPAHAAAKVAADCLDTADFYGRKVMTACVVRLKRALGVSGEVWGGWRAGKTTDLSTRVRSTPGLGPRPRAALPDDAAPERSEASSAP